MFCVLDKGIFSGVKLRKMTPKNPNENRQIFCCQQCDYSTSSKKDYSKHIMTLKHKKGTFVPILPHKNPHRQLGVYSCELCLFSTRNRKDYQKHLLTNKHKANVHEYESMNHATSVVPHNDSNDVKAFVIELMKQNQQQHQDVIHAVVTQIKDIIPQISSNITNNTVNNTNSNNTFNMNVFLNETCKDAMNMDDFINSLHIGMEDLEYTANHGYVEGIGKILLRGLDALDVEKRPIHCSDMKREVMYIKNGDVWEKDTTDNQHLRKAILLIGRMNLRHLPPWMKAHPSFVQPNSPFSDVYAQIIMNTMVEDDVMGRKYTTKIIKNIAQKIYIDRTRKLHLNTT